MIRKGHQSKFQKRIQKVIEDAKKFNMKLDDFIRDTERKLELPPPKINRGIIRVMNADECKQKQLKIKKINEYNYMKAKQKYENDLHNIMEMLIAIKDK